MKDNILNIEDKIIKVIKFTSNFINTEIVIWDNKSVIHYAISDYFPNRGLGYRRVMDRIAIRGEGLFNCE